MLNASHVFIGDHNVRQRVPQLAQNEGSAHLHLPLEIVLNHAIASKKVKLDPKNIKLHNADAEITMASRLNLMLLMDSAPDIVMKNKDLLGQVWFGQSQSVRTFANLPEVQHYRREQGLPSLEDIHALDTREYREMLKTNTLHGRPLPARPTKTQGYAVLFEAGGFGTLDRVRNIVKAQKFEVREFNGPRQLAADHEGYYALVFARLLIERTVQFFHISNAEVRRHDDSAIAEVNDQLEIGDTAIFLNKSALELYMSSVQVPDNVKYHGVIDSFDAFRRDFFDTVNHMTYDHQNIAIHVVLIFDEINGKTNVVAWQISRERNKALIQNRANAALHMEGDLNSDEDMHEDMHDDMHDS